MIALLVLLALGGLMHAAGTFTGAATSGTLLAFGYLLLVAYFTGRVVSKLGLPRLTGYLLAGVVSGAGVLGLVTPEMTGKLKVVNEVATCILGLVAGAELKLAAVRPVMRTIRATMVFAVLGGMIALAGAVYLLRDQIPIFDGLDLTGTLAICGLLGVALIPQSPAIALAMLSETRAEGPLSRFFLALVVVADLVVVIVYSIVAAVAAALLGSGVDIGETALSVGWELVGSIGFGIALGMLVGVYVRRVGRGAPLFALLVCVVVAEIGKHVHLDSLIVMLAAGIWLANFSRADADDLIHEFETAQLPVFLVWFALAGMRLDLDQLWTLIVPVLALVAARMVAFYLGTRIACARTDADSELTSYAWIGLVPQAGLSLALVVAIQAQFPAFGKTAANLMLSVLGVNQLISPILLRWALVQSGEAGRKRATDFASH